MPRRPALFPNLGNGKFEEVGAKAGGALTKKYVGRAALTADFWNRGRQDVLMTTVDGSPVLLRNEVPMHGHWLRIKTIGSKSNRDGLGAKIEIVVADPVGGPVGGPAEKSTRYQEVRAGSSFESSSDPVSISRPERATKVDAIVIRWPSGQVDKLGPEATRSGTYHPGSSVIERHPAIRPPDVKP